MDLSAFAGKHTDEDVGDEAVADSFRDAEGKRNHKNGKCCRQCNRHVIPADCLDDGEHHDADHDQCRSGCA